MPGHAEGGTSLVPPRAHIPMNYTLRVLDT